MYGLICSFLFFFRVTFLHGFLHRDALHFRGYCVVQFFVPQISEIQHAGICVCLGRHFDAATATVYLVSSFFVIF